MIRPEREARGAVTGEPAAFWRGWADRWDEFQSGYVCERGAQLDVVADYALEWSSVFAAGRTVRILDLGCGTGSVLARIAARHREVEMTGVDIDPLVLAIAEACNAGHGIRFLRRDLSADGWTSEVGSSYDVVTMVTCAHWFELDELASIYAGVGRVLGPKGLLIVADIIPDNRASAALGRLQLHRTLNAQTSAVAAGSESWQGFWTSVDRAPAFATLLAERGEHVRTRPPCRFPGVSEHEDAMAAAGLIGPAHVWRRDASAVLVAER